MPKRAGRSAYVLVLRGHDEKGSGYSLELAPIAATDGPPRVRGRTSTGEEAAATTTTGTGTGTGTGARAQGSNQWREEVAGGAPSRAQGLASTRQTATTSGTGPRARGDGPVRQAATATAAGRPPRPRGSHARGPDTAVDVAADGPRGGDGERCLSDVADEIGDDIVGDEGDRILREMRTLMFSQPQDSVKFDDSTKNLKVREREVVIPVFLSPKKGKNKKEEIWNKRQILYGIALLGLLGFVPAIVVFLPQWALLLFAAVWGLSSIGFPFGLYGTSELEIGYSRHMGRLIFLGFCLFVIFLLYHYMPQPVDNVWTVCFAIVGVIVMAGHVVSWVTGCMTGSDNDCESESSREEDTTTSDLLERLLGFSDE